MNCFVEENSLKLPIGTKITVKRKRVLRFANYRHYSQTALQIVKPIQLINGPIEQTFYAIFDENDVDFEICCDNQLCPRGIKLTLIINEKKHPFYIPPHYKQTTFQALETDGRKLHFLSQNTEEGQQLVADTADKRGTSFAEASVNCSKIIFSVEVEKCLKEQVFSDAFDITFSISLLGIMCVHIQTLTGKTTDVLVGINNTVLDLKKLFAKQEGTSVNQTLIYNGVSLINDKALNYYDIHSHSKLYVLYNSGFTPPITSLSGYGLSSISNSSALVDRTTHSLEKLNVGYRPTLQGQRCKARRRMCGNISDTSPSPGASTTMTFGSTHPSQRNSNPINLPAETGERRSPSSHTGFNTGAGTTFMRQPKSELSHNSTAPLFSGERGVVCYGERSHQKFTSYDNFKPDYNLIVNSFVIEMRMQSKYVPDMLDIYC